MNHQLKSKTLLCEFHRLDDVNQVDVYIVDITEQKIAKDELYYQAFHDVIRDKTIQCIYDSMWRTIN